MPPADPPLRTDWRPPIVEELSLADAGITSVLWTTGYRQRLDWIQPSITDEWGFARQVDGASTDVAGLFFLGSLWQVDQASATLFGVPRDARTLAVQLGIPADVCPSSVSGGVAELPRPDDTSRCPAS